jgi:hypothetical protein
VVLRFARGDATQFLFLTPSLQFRQKRLSKERHALFNKNISLHIVRRVLSHWLIKKVEIVLKCITETCFEGAILKGRAQIVNEGVREEYLGGCLSAFQLLCGCFYHIFLKLKE